MNYLTEENIKHEIDNAIQQVFRISGVKLTADDPIVAVLVLQKRNQLSAFFQLGEETQKLLDSVAEIKKYREQVLMELISETKRNAEQLEEQVTGLIGKYLTEFERSVLHRNLVANRVYLCAMGCLGILLGIVIHAFIF